MNQKGRRSGSILGGKDIIKTGIGKDLDLSVKVDVNGVTDGEKEDAHGRTATIA